MPIIDQLKNRGFKPTPNEMSAALARVTSKTFDGQGMIFQGYLDRVSAMIREIMSITDTVAADGGFNAFAMLVAIDLALTEIINLPREELNKMQADFANWRLTPGTPLFDDRSFKQDGTAKDFYDWLEELDPRNEQVLLAQIEKNFT